MSNQPKYNIGVYGATGFTGERIVLYLAKLQCTDQYSGPILIGGRSESRLTAVIDHVISQLGRYNISKIKIDAIGGISVDKSAALDQFTSQCNICISAAGPYRFLGPPVVQSCINTKTNYIDVTGEPEFIEKMIVTYDDQARDANISVVHACGFDSIPSDMGSIYTQQQFKQQYGDNAVVSHIDTSFTVKTGNAGMAANTGTWESLVHGLSSSGTLQSIRKQLKQKYSDTQPKRIGRASKPKMFYYDNKVHKWSLLFPGADASIVRNTQQQLTKLGDNNVQPYFAISFTVPSLFYAVLFALFGTLLKLMVSFKLGKSLLLKYPSIFSLGMFKSSGPTQQQLNQTSFTMNYFARGYKSIPSDTRSKPDLKLHTQLNAPEPGYVWTPIAAVESALVLLNSIKSTRSVPPGVLTPGAAFKNTELIERLNKVEGVQFRVLDAKISR